MTIPELVRRRVVESLGQAARKALAWVAVGLVALGSAMVAGSFRRRR